MRKHIDPSEIIPRGPPFDKRFKDITNQRFGRLTAVRFYGRSNTPGKFVYFWECLCDCGATRVINKSSLISGASTSCGCFRSECMSKLATKHGLAGSFEYGIWKSMWGRCKNPRFTHWANYGGRGITVCDRWKDFATFYADMGEIPSHKHSIDRIDNNGNYEPGNCRWATRTQQQRNRRNNRNITFRGETKPLVVWSEILGLEFHVLWQRLNHGWSSEKAFTQPIRKQRRL